MTSAAQAAAGAAKWQLSLAPDMPAVQQPGQQIAKGNKVTEAASHTVSCAGEVGQARECDDLVGR